MPFDVNPGSTKKDWLEGCVPFDGNAKYLPTGVHLPPNFPAKFSVIKLMKSWDVLRGEGLKTGIKLSAIKPDDIIIGATPNNDAIRAILATWGENQFLFTDYAGRKYKPKAWVRKYKTNPFVVLAIMRMSRK